MEKASAKETDELIRSFKRRKAVVRQCSAGLHETGQSNSQRTAKDGAAQDSDDAGVSEDPGKDIGITALIRARKANARGRSGVKVADHAVSSSTTQTSAGLVPTSDSYSHTLRLEKSLEPKANEMDQIVSRFAPQTGQVVDRVDPHMMAFIDAEMAKRTVVGTVRANGNSVQSDKAPIPAQTERTSQQPVSSGKLLEVDLASSTNPINAVRRDGVVTKNKIKVAASRSALSEPNRSVGKKQKSLALKSRDQRDSADIARDRMVEELMHEARLDIYDDDHIGQPDVAGSGAEADDADDRIADQFRREFFDAINERRSRARPANTASTAQNAKAVVDARAKGPKLGGSRSARAAMREREEAAAKAAKR